MLKLPSPSVVCAQNSPVILIDRLHAQAIDLDRVDAVATRVQRIDILLAIQIVAILPERAADALHLLVFLKIGLRPGRSGVHDVPALAVAQTCRSASLPLAESRVSVSPLFTSNGRT